MTPIADASTDAAPGLGRTLRACALVSLVPAAAVAVLWLSGVLPAESRTPLLIGTALAIVTCTLGTGVLAWTATVRDDDPHRVARAYVAGLGGNLALQLAAVVVGLLAFSLRGEKFPGLAAFGLSFAATAMLVQIAGALSIARFLRQRARRDRPGPTGSQTSAR